VCLRAFFHSSLTKYSSSYYLCSLAPKNRALGKWLPGQRVGVDLRFFVKGEQQGSPKAEVINACFSEESSVRTAPSNQAGQLEVEPMKFYQKAAANAKAMQSPGGSSELKADL